MLHVQWSFIICTAPQGLHVNGLIGNRHFSRDTCQLQSPIQQTGYIPEYYPIIPQAALHNGWLLKWIVTLALNHRHKHENQILHLCIWCLFSLENVLLDKGSLFYLWMSCEGKTLSLGSSTCLQWLSRCSQGVNQFYLSFSEGFYSFSASSGSSHPFWGERGCSFRGPTWKLTLGPPSLPQMFQELVRRS